VAQLCDWEGNRRSGFAPVKCVIVYLPMGSVAKGQAVIIAATLSYDTFYFPDVLDKYVISLVID